MYRFQTRVDNPAASRHPTANGLDANRRAPHNDDGQSSPIQCPLNGAKVTIVNLCEQGVPAGSLHPISEPPYRNKPSIFIFVD
jgi:hypothetical protein